MLLYFVQIQFLKNEKESYMGMNIVTFQLFSEWGEQG